MANFSARRGAKGMTAGHVRTQKSIKLISARCVSKGLRRALVVDKTSSTHPQQQRQEQEQDVHRGRKLWQRFRDADMDKDKDDWQVASKSKS